MNQKITDELKELNGFEAWLKTQQGQIGLARNACDCPLSAYLKFLLPNEDLIVSLVGITVGADDFTTHSRLSYNFIRQVDDGRKDNQPVTARQALSALKPAREVIARDAAA